MVTPTRNEPSRDISRASTPELFSGLLADVKEIAVGHLGRMRTEISDEFTGLKLFLAKVAVAVGIGVAGTVLLAHTFAKALASLGMPEWVGYLIAASILMAAGIVLFKRLPADKTNIDLVPESAIAAFKRDVTEVKDDARAVGQQVRTEP